MVKCKTCGHEWESFGKGKYFVCQNSECLTREGKKKMGRKPKKVVLDIPIEEPKQPEPQQPEPQPVIKKEPLHKQSIAEIIFKRGE